jgi:hypothetical protein
MSITQIFHRRLSCFFCARPRGKKRRQAIRGRQAKGGEAPLIPKEHDPYAQRTACLYAAPPALPPPRRPRGLRYPHSFSPKLCPCFGNRAKQSPEERPPVPARPARGSSHFIRRLPAGNKPRTLKASRSRVPDPDGEARLARRALCGIVPYIH